MIASSPPSVVARAFRRRCFAHVNHLPQTPTDVPECCSRNLVRSFAALSTKPSGARFAPDGAGLKPIRSCCPIPSVRSKTARFSSGEELSDVSGVELRDESPLVTTSPTTVWKSLTRRILLLHPENVPNLSTDLTSAVSTTSTGSIEPDSSLNSSRLSEIEECLKWWGRQRPVTLESVDTVWKLWDVLFTHTKKASAAPTEDEPPSSTSAFLNLALDHWRLGLLDGVELEQYAVETVWSRLQQDWMPQATAKSFGLVLSAVAAQSRPYRTDQPLPFLANDILEFCLSRDVFPSSDPVLWNSTLGSWARAENGAAAAQASEQALALLHRMKEMKVTPNQISYASVLQALSNTAGVRSSYHETLASQAMQVLDEMFSAGLTPNDVCYLNALQTLVRCHQLDFARDLLLGVIQDYQSGLGVDRNEDMPSIKPTPHMFGAVMTGYAHQGNVGQVLALWTKLCQLYEQEELTASTLNFILQALARKRTLQSAQQAQDLLESICATQSKVDTACYNTVLNAWAECVHHNPSLCVQHCQILLQQVPHPDTISFTSTIKAWARSDLPEAAEKCMAFLEAMWDSHRRNSQDQASTYSAKPNAITYSTVMYAWSRSHKQDAPLKAETLFFDMMRLYKAGDEDLKPNEASYVALLTTWNRSSSPVAAKKVQFYFDQWKSVCIANNMPVSIKVYHLLLNSKRRKGDGVSAERVLQEVIDLGQRYQYPGSKISAYTFQEVMNAHINSNHADAAERAESLLLKMKQLDAQGWKGCNPTAVTYSIVLSAWAKSRRPDGPERAEILLRDMQASDDPTQQPTAHCYAAVLTAWSRSRQAQAPDRAQALFDEMLDRYRAGYGEFRPSTVPCTALLLAWSRSSRPESAEKALTLLNEMEDRHRQDPRNDRPNRNHFSIVIDAFAAKGDVENAHAVLERILGSGGAVEPHVNCYNGYLKAIVESGAADAAERAEAFLRSMPSTGPGRPDTLTYSTCLLAWQRAAPLDASAPERAERLLWEMVRRAMAKRAQGSRVKPTVQEFRAYLDVLSRSASAPLEEKVERADRAVAWMHELGILSTKEFRNEFQRLKLGSAVDRGRNTSSTESEANP